MLKFSNLWITIINLLFLQAVAHGLNITETREIIAKILQLKDVLAEAASPYLKITINDVSQNCIQMQCKFVCFSGKINEIETDIRKASLTMRLNCTVIEELCLYNYNFPDGIIPRNFLGEYGQRIQSLYVAKSNVTDIESGAFGNGIFEKLFLENLQLVELRKDFFDNISKDFKSLTIIQKETPVKAICTGFLDHVKYQIKYLAMQVGISCVRNMTASDTLLNALGYVDFSYNDLGAFLAADTFNRLSLVEHLDLSHSQITVLPESVFADLMDTLDFLDISFNQLKTISSDIFGWQKSSNDLTIYANDNQWECNCALRTEMKLIYGKKKATIFCETPAEYHEWSVFDDRLCETAEASTALTLSTPFTANTAASTVRPPTTTKSTTAGGATTSTWYYTTTHKPMYGDVINLECIAQISQKNKTTPIKRPAVQFVIEKRANSKVDVILTTTDSVTDEYGLIWFSKVTKEFYKMEVNYNEYGLGCYGTISLLTTIENLLPNIAYTFCLVRKDQLTISPFSCKSSHIAGNLGVRYHAWLTRDLRATGISVAVLGVVMFTFIGISAVFLLLKRRPTLLKGSKRVTTKKGSTNEIVVLPKDRTLEELRHKEQILAKRYSKSTIAITQQRRCSTDSSDSNDSYMNANIYEELPAYLKLNASPAISVESDNYTPSILTASSTADLVSYAEIPFRHKRTSNDPLPEVPKERIIILNQLATETHQIIEDDFESNVDYALTHNHVV